MGDLRKTIIQNLLGILDLFENLRKTIDVLLKHKQDGHAYKASFHRLVENHTNKLCCISGFLKLSAGIHCKKQT